MPANTPMQQILRGVAIGLVIMAIIVLVYFCWAYFSYRWSIENICRAAALKFNRMNKKRLDKLVAIADQDKSSFTKEEASIVFNIIRQEGLSSTLIRTEGPIKYLIKTSDCSSTNESCLEI